MVSMERKNIWRREESERVREGRIITGYVKYKYPEVFSEARDFYEELNHLYPGKKDLRRTNEFEWLKTGTGTKQRKFYQRRKKDQKKKKQTTDNMVLRIPLLGQAETSAGTAEVTRETAEAEVTRETAEAEVTRETAEAEVTRETAEAEVTRETAEITQETEIPIVIEPQEVTLPPIPDEILEDIMNGLREDPDIRDIFDEFDFEEISPLESELLQW